MDNGSSNGIQANEDLHTTMNTKDCTSNGELSYGQPKFAQSEFGPKDDSTSHAALSEKIATMGQLPPGIKHITEGFLSLPRLLARRAQVSHNTMIQIIHSLADMPMTAPQTNGYTNGTQPDDVSVENMKKKVQFLKYAEKEHADWVKALVITSWARVSEDVRKLIDLKVHIDTERLHYDFALDKMVEIKRNLIHARLPNPDLKTALEVLSTGKASWMPDLGYIETPPFKASELLRSLRELNTMLNIRLSLHEHDKIPEHFKDFSIRSGRVTFRVTAEFELDLTIADDSVDARFWFIDFRFLFSPTAMQIPNSLRGVIEDRVNAMLEKDGLEGAYKFLHELTLTYKIGELRRQTQKLCRERWIGSLKVEPLHRALSIQYWIDRHGVQSSKNWIIIGVQSGRNVMKHDKLATSCIQLRCFRDAVEIKDFDVQLDLEHLSAEQLIEVTIHEHTFHVLYSLYTLLKKRPLYQKELGLTLHMEPEMYLDINLSWKESISIHIEPVSGRYAIKGRSGIVASLEMKLNSQSRTSSAVVQEIEAFRSKYICDKVMSQSLSLNWIISKNPGVSILDVRAAAPKETNQIVWLRRSGWHRDWFVAMTSGATGESFWLYRITGQAPAMKIRTSILIPQLSAVSSFNPCFFSNLRNVSTALVSSYHNLEALHFAAIPNATTKTADATRFPAILVDLSKILPSVLRPWAKNILLMSFLGIEPESMYRPTSDTTSDNENLGERGIVVVQAKLIDALPTSLDIVGQWVDKDIIFHPTSGAFALRLLQRNGESVVSALKDRLLGIEQLVHFIHTIKKHDPILKLESIALGKIDISYDKMEAEDSSTGKHHASINYSKDPGQHKITFERGNPHIHLVSEFTKILNSRESLDGVASLLPITLPVVRAFDYIEDSWSENDLGEVVLLSRAADHHIIRWTLSNLDMHVDIRVKLQFRGNESWWSFQRSSRLGQQIDLVDTALTKKVWSVAQLQDNPDWISMHTSALAKGPGVEILLGMIDEVMKELSHEVKAIEDEPKSVINKEPAPILPPKKPQLARQQSMTGHLPLKVSGPPSLTNRAVSNQQQSQLQSDMKQQKRKKKDAGNTIVID